MDFVIRRQSEKIDSNYNEDLNNSAEDDYDYRKWEWGYLRTECENLFLETFYNTYVQRLQRSYLSIFLAIHTLVGIVHIVALVASQSPATSMSPELYCYIGSILIVWITLTATFKEDLMQAYPKLPYIMSCLAVIGLVTTDIIVPLYHTVVNQQAPPLRPAYECYILFIIYIFLPLTQHVQCVILGAITTGCYMIEMSLITYRNDEQIASKCVTEFIFLFCVNFFGFYFRMMNEIAIRRAFLDRRECVEGNMLLKLARDQEKNLLLSILPAHTALAIEKDIRRMIEKIRDEKRMAILQELSPRNLESAPPIARAWRSRALNKLYVEHHTGVSVLYADIVNFTYMTTQLPVKVLVETLHELFVKFDQASEENNVLRIKFLGDCYYCVSGVPERNPYHAKSCVDLGLRMIRDIREVRASKNNLNIDMRIGIHSGSIMSGVIGACKWQYDIWSQDASIANRMESTGEPGKVHVTRQTLEMLDDQYLYEPGTEKASADEFLRSNKIDTFLISPQYFVDTNYFLPDDSNLKRFSLGVKRLIARNSKIARTKITPEAKPSIRRNFMQNSMEQYLEVMKQTNTEMAKELERMPIGKFHFNHIFSSSSTSRRLTSDNNHIETERTSFSSNVSPLLLRFKDKSWEWSFMREPDLMLKYSTSMSLLVFMGILGMQILNNPNGTWFWWHTGITATVLVTLIPITWFKKVWIICNASGDDNINTLKPKNKVFRYLYNTSRKIVRNASARIAIYLVTIIFLSMSSLIHLTECWDENEIILLDGAIIDTYSPCMHPWVITQSLVLAICLNFLFVRIHFILKLSVGACMVGIYIWIVFFIFKNIYQVSSSISASLNANISHILMVILIFIIFHMIDRQTEYISRVDYTWKKQLQKKQVEADITKDTIKVLVQNILPVHVAEIYMSRQIKDELYYEVYDNVAIMFATITNFDIQSDAPINTEKNILSILNRIICDFDERLIAQTGSLKIEKIKVAGWTYMVACGLDPGRADSSASLLGGHGTNIQRSSLMSNGRRSWNTYKAHSKEKRRVSLDEPPIVTEAIVPVEPSPLLRKTHNAAYVLAQFALEIMQALYSFNAENFKTDGQLRIGISHGNVMAGVVGSKKPLYDVWGNAVNMASRMDSTGIPGRIQVTLETAEVLQSFGVKCEYRGKTFVKGRGAIPTYFVCVEKNGVDDPIKFVRNQDEVTRL